MPLKSVEEQIRAARERGDFDNLAGRGKPLDHTKYFKRPEHLRLAHHLLEANGFVPPEVEAQREIGELTAQLEATEDETECARLRREIGRLRVKVEMFLRQNRK